ncbi:MAG: SusC/RagA family TonB-linked outer membrane protein [Bacteroidales bacterium]|jgi:TonB-linked SusC/RagA family outer membrane protein|nr:SusC/RagA family TonB-linked outer membrane protein [Bacteroidales bacterium]
MAIHKFLSRPILCVLALIASLTFSAGPLSAQNATVTGKITDNNGEPVEGVTVIVKGTKSATATDANGNYSIKAPGQGSLVFTFIGYKEITIPINNRKVVNATLNEDTIMLNNVVVTAMGIKKERKALGYSVTELGSKELLKNKNTNVVNELAGKIPGVNITQSGGAAGAGASIVIRGGNSASETRDNQPLFVVDGIIYDNSTVNGGGSETDGTTRSNTTFSNRSMDINPEDIASLSVLKGAAAAALYGSRAADGVVIISTKKGSNNGTVRVNFSSKYTYSWANKLPEQQAVYGRGTYNITGGFNDYTTNSWGEKISGTVYNNVKNFFNTGSTMDNNVSIAGGNKNSDFYLSLSHYDQTGIIPQTGFEKSTFRFNGNQTYGHLKVGANVAYSYSKTDKTLTDAGLYDGGGNGAMTAVYGWSRSDDMEHWLNEDGTKYRMFEGLQTLNEDEENPYWIIHRNKLQDKNKRLTGSMHAEYKVTDWFNINYRIGMDDYVNDGYTYIAPKGAVLEKYQNGRLSKSKVSYNYLSSNLMLNFHKKIAEDFDFNLLLGHTAEATKRVRQNIWGYNFQTEGTISFANILDEEKYYKEKTTKKRLVGVYGEFRAAYKNIAYLTVTGRNDWSSTLPKSNRSYFYPSVSGSFVFTEIWKHKPSWFSFGKIRGSWAQVGKDADPYSTNTYMWPPVTVITGYTGIGNNWSGGSPNLKPEMQTAWEIGTEMRFFDGRLGLDYTYYNSTTKNQLCSPRLAQSTGYIFLVLNGGSVKNQGMELSLTGTPIETKNFSWNVTLNLSGNRGTLGDFIDGVDIFYVTDVQTGGVKAGSIPNGGDFLGLTGNYWKKDDSGTYIVDPKTGLYKDAESSTNIIGNREPKMIGGLSNTFKYKDWSLSFLLDIRLGGDIYNGTEYYLVQRGLSKKTLQRNSVTVTGVTEDGDPFNQTYNANDSYVIGGKTQSGRYVIEQYWKEYCNNSYNFLTKTNWLKLRSISVTYDFKNLIKHQKIIKGLTATLTGTNLWTWTNYKGMDPEVSVSGSGVGGSGSSGIDYCGVPAIAGMSLGVNLTF